MQKLSDESRRVGRFIVLVLGGVALVAVWFLMGGRAEPKAAATLSHASSQEKAARGSTRSAVRLGAPSAGRPPSSRKGPWIERIDVDKSEVCSGEENFANVRAFDGSGTSDRLIVSLSGSREMGFRLPFRIQKSDGVRTRRVLVTGPGGPPATMELPEVKVKDCEVAEQATIGVRLNETSPHVFELTAEIARAAGSAQRFEPVSYAWDFGDGIRKTTDSETVEHSYEGKPEKTRFSYFLISVEIKDRRGRVVTGSRAYGFPNFGFGTFVDDHQILVHSAGGSMQGEQAADERIRLYHGFEGVVRLERVRSIEFVRSTKRELASVEYSPTTLLGVNELRPGTSTPTRDLSSLRPTEPDRARKLELIGHAGSIEARGTILLTTTATTPDDTPVSG